jgi:hypothetical protein
MFQPLACRAERSNAPGRSGIRSAGCASRCRRGHHHVPDVQPRHVVGRWSSTSVRNSRFGDNLAPATPCFSAMPTKMYRGGRRQTGEPRMLTVSQKSRNCQGAWDGHAQQRFLQPPTAARSMPQAGEVDVGAGQHGGSGALAAWALGEELL